MASLQDIRRRIRSVKSIQQITKAMKMVAAARLRRAQMAAVANKPYADKMAEVVENVAANVTDFKHPLLETYDAAEKKLFLIVAADKGLAGAYSSNIFKEAVRHIPDKEKADLVVIGRKTEEYFRNRGYHIVKEYLGISERPTFDIAKQIAAELTSRYESGEYSAVNIIYARFVSSMVNIPETFQLLPFEGITNEEEEAEPTKLDKAGAFIAHLKAAALAKLPPRKKPLRKRRKKRLRRKRKKRGKPRRRKRPKKDSVRCPRCRICRSCLTKKPTALISRRMIRRWKNSRKSRSSSYRTRTTC